MIRVMYSHHTCSLRYSSSLSTNFLSRTFGMSVSEAIPKLEGLLQDAVQKLSVFRSRMTEVAGFKARMDEFNCNMHNLISSMEMVGSCNSFAAVESLAEQRRQEQKEMAERLARNLWEQTRAREDEVARKSSSGKRAIGSAISVCSLRRPWLTCLDHCCGIDII